MELRPAQTALMAGRTAWRLAAWRTSPPLPSPISICASTCLLHRHLSTSRALFQQAEAAAEASAPEPQNNEARTSYGASNEFTRAAPPPPQQQQQQQQEQQAPQSHAPPPSQQQGQGPSVIQRARGIFASGPTSRGVINNNSNSSSSSNNSSLLAPWASQGTSVRTAPRVPTTGFDVTKTLGDLGIAARPMADDLNLLDPRLGQPSVAETKYRLRPVIGRTVEVKGRVDFARSLSLLEMKCAVNKVKADAFRQKFHERPGMKRKRLKMDRWRVRFKEGFRATVVRVKDLAKQGW